MSFPRYPSYKRSGVEWLGEVPEHWNVDRMKWAIEQPKNGIWGNEESGDENDIPCVRVADFDRQGLRVLLDNPTIRNVTRKEREGRVLVKNDLLIEKSGGGELQPVGCVVIYEDNRLAISSNFVAKASARSGMSASYWRYLHSAAYSARINTRSIKQTSGIQNLDQSQYLDESSCYPPLREQERIATFLNHETAKIDALIAEQQRLIELLQEKRQAVISHAVTKGLNPNAPMKDSGVEWLGEVPEHWEVKRVKHLCTSIEQGWSPQCENEPSDGDTPGILKVGCVNGGLFRPSENKKLPPDLIPIPEYSVRSGDLLVSRANTRELVGSAAVVSEDFPWLFICDKLYRITIRPDKTSANYLALFLASNEARGQIGLGASGASQSMQNISQSILMDLPIPLPHPEGQESIRNSIAIKCGKIDKLTAKASDAIALLQERRSALISAAVTGQIDVRGLVSEAEAA